MPIGDIFCLAVPRIPLSEHLQPPTVCKGWAVICNRRGAYKPMLGMDYIFGRIVSHFRNVSV